MSAQDEVEFIAIHAAGVKRHPRSWLAANEKAIQHLFGKVVEGYAPSGRVKRVFRLDTSLPKNKAVISNLVLRILDAVEAP